jgi:hypothetical protein
MKSINLSAGRVLEMRKLLNGVIYDSPRPCRDFYSMLSLVWRNHRFISPYYCAMSRCWVMPNGFEIDEQDIIEATLSFSDMDEVIDWANKLVERFTEDTVIIKCHSCGAVITDDNPRVHWDDKCKGCCDS